MLPELLGRIKALLADKAYDATLRVLDVLEEANIEAVIPAKANRAEQRTIDGEMCKWRHSIENFFQKLKQFRAIATRYDKRAIAFIGGIHLAVAVIWLN